MSPAEKYSKEVEKSNNDRMKILIAEIGKAGVGDQLDELMAIIYEPFISYQLREPK